MKEIQELQWVMNVNIFSKDHFKSCVWPNFQYASNIWRLQIVWEFQRGQRKVMVTTVFGVKIKFGRVNDLVQMLDLNEWLGTSIS